VRPVLPRPGYAGIPARACYSPIVNMDPTLSDPRDVRFALRAVLGAGAAPESLRAAESRLPGPPTVPELVDAALSQSGTAGDPAARARACALLAAYFDLDPATDPDPCHSP
jgi:hypothetical protein